MTKKQEAEWIEVKLPRECKEGEVVEFKLRGYEQFKWMRFRGIFVDGAFCTFSGNDYGPTGISVAPASVAYWRPIKLKKSERP
jgi:hypothetical protein